MLDFFPEGPISEYPQYINVAFNFLWAFVLSAIIAITHRLTWRGAVYPKSFFQSLVLGAIVTTMVMLAIGDSLARGLGVFGAMAIIRFRTRIDDPRDVLFLFAALSTGLAIGVYGFTISAIGTLLFCLAACVLYYSPFRFNASKHHLFFNLAEPEKLKEVLALVNTHCFHSEQLAVQMSKEPMLKYQYLLSLKNNNGDELIRELSVVPGIKQVKILRIESII